MESGHDVESSNTAPRPVSRGASLHAGFLGIDSLYLVLEYPRRDVFDFWLSLVNDLNNPELYEGIVFEDFVIRKGAVKYPKLEDQCLRGFEQRRALAAA